jgi:hypothetical protein
MRTSPGILRGSRRTKVATLAGVQGSPAGLRCPLKFGKLTFRSRQRCDSWLSIEIGQKARSTIPPTKFSVVCGKQIVSLNVLFVNTGVGVEMFDTPRK